MTVVLQFPYNTYLCKKFFIKFKTLAFCDICLPEKISYLNNVVFYKINLQENSYSLLQGSPMRSYGLITNCYRWCPIGAILIGVATASKAKWLTIHNDFKMYDQDRNTIQTRSGCLGKFGDRGKLVVVLVVNGSIYAGDHDAVLPGCISSGMYIINLTAGRRKLTAIWVSL